MQIKWTNNDTNEISSEWPNKIVNICNYQSTWVLLVEIAWIYTDRRIIFKNDLVNFSAFYFQVKKFCSKYIQLNSFCPFCSWNTKKQHAGVYIAGPRDKHDNCNFPLAKEYIRVPAIGHFQYDIHWKSAVTF